MSPPLRPSLGSQLLWAAIPPGHVAMGSDGLGQPSLGGIGLASLILVLSLSYTLVVYVSSYLSGLLKA